MPRWRQNAPLRANFTPRFGCGRLARARRVSGRSCGRRRPGLAVASRRRRTSRRTLVRPLHTALRNPVERVDDFEAGRTCGRPRTQYPAPRVAIRIGRCRAPVRAPPRRLVRVLVGRSSNDWPRRYSEGNATAHVGRGLRDLHSGNQDGYDRRRASDRPAPGRVAEREMAASGMTRILDAAALRLDTVRVSPRGNVCCDTDVTADCDPTARHAIAPSRRRSMRGGAVRPNVRARPGVETVR